MGLRSRAAKWGAVLALALLAVAAAPHVHDADTSSESCVLCHVDDAPYVAISAAQALAHPIALRAVGVLASEATLDAALDSHGARAPPA